MMLKVAGLNPAFGQLANYISEKTVSVNPAVNGYLFRIKDQVAKRPFHMLCAIFTGHLKPTFSTLLGYEPLRNKSQGEPLRYYNQGEVLRNYSQGEPLRYYSQRESLRNYGQAEPHTAEKNRKLSLNYPRQPLGYGWTFEEL